MQSRGVRQVWALDFFDRIFSWAEVDEIGRGAAGSAGNRAQFPIGWVIILELVKFLRFFQTLELLWGHQFVKIRKF